MISKLGKSIINLSTGSGYNREKISYLHFLCHKVENLSYVESKFFFYFYSYILFDYLIKNTNRLWQKTI